MERLFEAADRLEAQQLLDLLQEHGVEAVILGDYLSGGAGELPVDIHPTLWLLNPQNRSLARALLAAFLAGPQATASSWTCPGCGEIIDGQFQLCWRCCTARPSP